MSHTESPALRLVSYTRPTEPTHTCDTCGIPYAPGTIAVGLLRGDEPIATLICPECVKAGPVAVAEKIRDRAAAHRDRADQLHADAAHCEQQAELADAYATEIECIAAWPALPVLLLNAAARGAGEAVTP